MGRNDNDDISPDADPFDVVNLVDPDMPEAPLDPFVVGYDEADLVIDNATRAESEALARQYSGDEEGGGPFTDDFVKLRVQEAKARAEYPGDDLAQQASMVQQKVAAAQDVAPAVHTAPASARRSVLSGQAGVVPGQAPQQVVQWTGDESEATNVSIMFAPVAPPTSGIPANTAFRPFVRVQFGNTSGGGGFASIDIDVGMGGLVCLPASVVNVLVGMDSSSVFGAGIGPYILTASIAFGRITRNPPLTLTSYVATGSKTNVLRPNFATGITLQRGTVTDQYLLEFKDAGGTVISTRVIGPNTYLEVPIELSGDIATVDVTNQGPTTNAGCRLLWVLSV